MSASPQFLCEAYLRLAEIAINLGANTRSYDYLACASEHARRCPKSYRHRVAGQIEALRRELMVTEELPQTWFGSRNWSKKPKVSENGHLPENQ